MTLATVALLLRRALGMNKPADIPADRRAAQCAELRPLYLAVTQEIETQTAILGITLNDAFGEREAGRHEIAWNVARLALGEWERLAELVLDLQGVLGRSLPFTRGVAVNRRAAVSNFKSRAVIDNVALYEFLDQVLFSSRHRFALKLRLLGRTTALLRREFRNTCREGEHTLDASARIWTRLDQQFHDFDLIIKETILAFRSLLSCQSPEGARELQSHLRRLLEKRTSVSVLTPGK